VVPDLTGLPPSKADSVRVKHSLTLIGGTEEKPEGMPAATRGRQHGREQKERDVG